jgi:hypothetical protein
LVHIQALWIEIETVAGFCIVDGFDFEDSKAFVGLRFLHVAGWRSPNFADAELTVGNGGGIGRATAAASRERDCPWRLTEEQSKWQYVTFS